MKVFTKRTAPICAVALLLIGSTARATVIAPNSSFTGPAATALTPGGAVPATTGGAYTIGSDGAGTYSVRVYSPDADNGGRTTIWFTVNVTAGDLNRITLTNFTGFTTDVFKVAGRDTTFVDRNVGNTVGLNFNGPGVDGLGPTAGNNTVTYLIRTNAPSYTGGTINLIDGGVTAQASFGPAVPLPAPVWMGLTLLGGAGGIGRLKKFFRRDQAC